jgi:hypothetical protein
MRETAKGTPWSDTDDDDLRTAIAGGATVEDAATFLCRTPDDVAIRAAILGLRGTSSFIDGLTLLASGFSSFREDGR